MYFGLFPGGTRRDATPHSPLYLSLYLSYFYSICSVVSYSIVFHRIRNHIHNWNCIRLEIGISLAPFHRSTHSHSHSHTYILIHTYRKHKTARQLLSPIDAHHILHSTFTKHIVLTVRGYGDTGIHAHRVITILIVILIAFIHPTHLPPHPPPPPRRGSASR